MSRLHWQWLPFSALPLSSLYAILQLRQEVFVVEQTCAYLDADGADPLCHHLLGWQGDALCAYLRAFPPHSRRPEAVVGRVVTAPAARRQGLGHALMLEGHRRIAVTWGAGPIWLSAQSYLLRFYRDLGYEIAGPGYDEDGIPHLPMRHPFRSLP